jgi:hypothetical protein
MIYILNSAVITSPGSYTYQLITPQEAELIMTSNRYRSTIRYEETARALSALLRIHVPMNDEIVKMRTGDQAIVFRLVFPRGHRRIPTDAKGNLSMQFVLDHHELGLLHKVG